MAEYHPEELLDTHKTLTSFDYTLRPVERGYAGRTLYVDLSTNSYTRKTCRRTNEACLYRWKGFWLVAALERN